jgi:serine/threonine protein phosphatase PrpC
MAALALNADAVLLAVADGCGGMPAGDRASRAAVEALAEAVGQAGEADPVSVVLAGFDRANAAVADLRLGSGSTLTAVLIDGPTARVFHAGDSPAAVIGQRGAVRFATLAHSPVGFGVEAGILSHEEAENHADSGVVLNVLGFAEMFVHVGPPVRLRPMDTVVVASDALTDNLTMGRITEISRRGRAVRALQALIDETMHVMSDPAVGHADDLSLLLYRPTRRKGE